MFLKKFILFVVSIFTITAFAQNNLLNNLKLNPNYQVKILADSTVEVYDKTNQLRLKKSIAEKPANKNSTPANLIIELDTVKFAAYKNYYRLVTFN
jgi:hypothetical protein